MNINLAAVEEIYNESFDQQTWYAAELIANRINVKFVCSICIWYEVLEQFERMSKSLHKVELNLSSAVLLLRDLNEFLDPYKLNKCDEAFQDAFFIEENDIPSTFETKFFFLVINGLKYLMSQISNCNRNIHIAVGIVCIFKEIKIKSASFFFSSFFNYCEGAKIQKSPW